MRFGGFLSPVSAGRVSEQEAAIQPPSRLVTTETASFARNSHHGRFARLVNRVEGTGLTRATSMAVNAAYDLQNRLTAWQPHPCTINNTLFSKDLGVSRDPAQGSCASRGCFKAKGCITNYQKAPKAALRERTHGLPRTRKTVPVHLRIWRRTRFLLPSTARYAFDSRGAADGECCP